MEPDVTRKTRRWFRRPWCKILTFIFLTPVWVLIVWLDPDEKRSMKVFATVILALVLAVSIQRFFGPDAVAERKMRLKWDNASPMERLGMLSSNGGHFAFRIISDGTPAKIKDLFGSPDQVTGGGDFVYYIKDSHTGGTNAMYRIRFGKDGKVSGMDTSR